MLLEFKNYLKLLGEYSFSSDYAGGAFLPTTVSGSEVDNTLSATGHDPSTVPGVDFLGPQVTRRSKLVRLNYTRPVIEMELEDGTQLKMSRAQFERAGGRSFIPNQTVLTVILQRNPQDNGRDMSKVLSVKSDSVPN